MIFGMIVIFDVVYLALLFMSWLVDFVEWWRR